MRRREFITLIGGAVIAWPVAARGQADPMRRIAVLMGSAANELGKTYLRTFFGQLEQLGWVDGRSSRSEVRWWTSEPEQMQVVATNLLAFSPHVFMVFSNPAVALLKPMAGNIPIVFVGVGDPIGDGFVSNLARPGGNITGFAGTDGPIGSKWLEVLIETAPQLTRVMMLMHPETPIHKAFWRSMEAAARRFGIQVTPGGVHDAREIERVITSFAMRPDGGIVVAPHAITWANEDMIIDLALRHRLPTHYATAASIAAGGLVSYGHDFEDALRKTAQYVDRILRGEKPGDLPVQMPTKFRLVLNLKTAKTIGLEIPPTLLARADEVIE